MSKDYEAVIGIETHVQLKTKSKLFCGCSNDSRGAEPNTNLCPVCLGLPGTLPVLNAGAVKLALHLGLALNAEVAATTKFDRKNYFYPDLPKGYQITQYDQPVVGKGYVELPASGKKIGIVRAHLEEDAGKLVHPAGADHSLVDLNRAGTPLVEIVSEPDIRSPAEAKEYAQELYNIVRYAEVSEADLFEGNMRFDVNVSVRPKGSTQLGTRSETKNLNSFRAVEKASEYEIKRQTELLQKGQKVVQETRGWDEAKGKTLSQRSKEEAHDYRYFPEPDVPPVVITADLMAQAKAALPPLPRAVREQLLSAGLTKEEVEFFINMGPELVQGYLKEVVPSGKEKANMLGKLWISAPEESRQKMLELWKTDYREQLIRSSLAAVTATIKGEISHNQLKKYEHSLMIGQKVEAPKKQMSDTDAVEMIVAAVIKDNQKAVDDYKSGNANSLQFLVGQVMQHSKGQANPAVARELLEQKLK